MEYLIILAVVIGFIISVAVLLKPKIDNSYDSVGNKMKDMLDR